MAETGQSSAAPPPTGPSNPYPNHRHDGSPYQNAAGKRKRDHNLGSGSRGFGSKKRHMGRNEYSRENDRNNETDRRSRTEQERNAKAAGGTDARNAEGDDKPKEDRKPKRKVAVMIGYSGTGYKGMQASPDIRTIEGDLFDAFVRAGAISKDNADDPKKSSFARCARTDKGVHAAGNMISLKMIVEDSDIVEKINKQLCPQIRVWGIERTINSFSCYQACDSRWYEYLIPSHAFLPPHPSSFLAKHLEQSANEMGDRAGYDARQEQVRDFWSTIDERDIKPILNGLDENIRAACVEALYRSTDEQFDLEADKDDEEGSDDGGDEVKSKKKKKKPVRKSEEATESTSHTKIAAEATATGVADEAAPTNTPTPSVPPFEAARTDTAATDLTQVDTTPGNQFETDASDASDDHPRTIFRRRLADAIKKIKSAYESAKRQHRITDERKQQIQRALDEFVGSNNFHNYTVNKSFRDASASRHIKSVVLDRQPVYIDPKTGQASTDSSIGTEWLSIKIHGQSFMMHQIRKMIGLATLLVRCGADASKRIPESYRDCKWAIPKVPGLGLLLERPVFDTYNTHTATKHERGTIGFEPFEKQIFEFKKTEIYRRIFDEEAKDNTFHNFFNHVDNYAKPTFLYVTSKGYEATCPQINGSSGAERGTKQQAAGAGASAAAGKEEAENADQSAQESTGAGPGPGPITAQPAETNGTDAVAIEQVSTKAETDLVKEESVQ